MGFVRLFLALSVVAAHAKGAHFGIPGLGGREAVLLFYVLSGFYMSLILNEKYTGPDSNPAFYKSRWLRLWVPYSAVMALVCVGYAFSGDMAIYAKTYAAAPLGVALFGALSNLFIVGQDVLWFFSLTEHGMIYRPMGEPGFNGVGLSLNAPLFSVSLELYFYLIAPFILRDRTRTFLFALAGLAYHALLARLNITALSFTYHAFPATIAYFGIGGALYHLGRARLAWVTPATLLSARLWRENWRGPDRGELAFIVLALGLFWTMNSFMPKLWLLGFAVAVPFLFALTQRWRLDRAVGELSYGVYIVHLPLIQMANKGDGDFLGIGQFGSTVVLALGASGLLYLLLERPLNRFRDRRFAPRMAPGGF